MYNDPAHIRGKRLNLSLNDAERRVIEAMAEFNGTQPSVFARELILEGLKRLSHGVNSGVGSQEMRASH